MKYNIYLNSIRHDKHLTQQEISNILGVSRSVYTKYENGYELIPIKHLLAFCNYFNIRVDNVFGFSFNKSQSLNNNVDNKIIGQRLRDFRKENKLTQEKLANTLNTTDTVISGYESGRRLIATPFLYQICHQYHVSADYLLGRIDEPKYLKEN